MDKRVPIVQVVVISCEGTQELLVQIAQIDGGQPYSKNPDAFSLSNMFLLDRYLYLPSGRRYNAILIVPLLTQPSIRPLDSELNIWSAH